MEQPAIAVHYQRMEEWLNDRRSVLGKKYKKEYTLLLQLAPKLEQLVRYDIPAQYRQQKKLLTALDESHKLIEEATKTTQNLEEKRTKLLQEYGLNISLGSIDDELQSAIDSRISASTFILNEILKDFGASAQFSTFREVYERTLLDYSFGIYYSGVFSLHFPWLNKVFEERFYLLKENKSQEQLGNETKKEAAAASFEIDWGDTGAPNFIDMEAAVEIKWDKEDTDDCTKDNDEKLPENTTEFFSIDLSNTIHRQNILTELQAIKCFASERSLMGDNSLDQCSLVVDILEKKLTTSTESIFLRIKSSPSLRLALIDEVQRFQRGIASAAMRKISNESRLRQIQEELEQLAPQLEKLLEITRVCRDECLAELQKMFPGRTVNIVGDINKYI